MKQRLKNFLKLIIVSTAHALPQWTKWRRVKWGKEARPWFRRVILFR